MANEQNLKPIRSVNEARELGRKGGIKSGETRRRKAALRDTMNRLLTMQVEVDGLSDILRSDGGESTYEEVIAMAMIQQASLGDVKAYQAIMKTVGQTEMSEAGHTIACALERMQGLRLARIPITCMERIQKQHKMLCRDLLQQELILMRRHCSRRAL